MLNGINKQQEGESRYKNGHEETGIKTFKANGLNNNISEFQRNETQNRIKSPPYKKQTIKR